MSWQIQSNDKTLHKKSIQILTRITIVDYLIHPEYNTTNEDSVWTLSMIFEPKYPANIPPILYLKVEKLRIPVGNKYVLNITKDDVSFDTIFDEI